MSPLVSVIIPCYRQAHFLDDSIGSALAQDHVHVEIIVVDDGSPDDVASVLRRYNGVRCIRQTNSGLAAARNAGLRASHGDYLLFLDADDRLTPGAIGSALAVLEARLECAFAYGHVRLINVEGRQLPTPIQRGAHENHYRALLAGNFIWTTGVALYRRSVLNEVGGFDITTHAAADFELNLRLARRWPVCCTEQVALEYRVHNTSMSRDPCVMLRESTAVLLAQKPHIRAQPELETAWRRGLHVLRLDYGEKLINRVHADLRAGKWLLALYGTGVLLHYYRTGLAKRLLRRARELLCRTARRPNSRRLLP